MRAFIVLCLVAVACADDLGYNYQAGGTSGFASNNAPSYAVHESSGPSFGAAQASNGSPSYGSQGSVGPSYGGPGSSGSPSYDAQGSNGSPSFAPQGELEKEFFTFSANDDDFNDPAASNQYANSVKQGLRVVFIKGPENRGLEDAALNLAKQAAGQHTDIYVLNKQADIGDLANRLNNANNNNNNKPEVHFVKYRTPEDAANAQRAIQGQYDALGGKSQHIDGGVAPALNFASQAPVHAPSASAPGGSYLPASVFRH